MNNILKHSIKLLNKNQKFKLILICFLTLIGALLETLGVGIVVPFLSIFIESDTKNSFFEHTFLSNILKTENIIFFKNYNPILSGSLIILIIFTIKNFYLLYLQWFNAKFTFDVETSLSKRLLDLYLSQKYSFFLKRNSANLIRNIKEEVVYFRAKIVNQIYTVFIDLLTIFCILILLIFINPQASIFAIVFMVLASLIYLSFTKTKIKRLAIQRQYHDEIRLKSLQHSFTGIKQIKVSGNTIKARVDLGSKKTLRQHQGGLICSQHLHYLLNQCDV